MNSSDSGPRRPSGAALVWWIIWFATLSGLVMIYMFLGRQPAVKPEAAAVLDYIGLAPLLISSALRWLVLPRTAQPGPALVVFIMGVALAEACGILGIFLGSRPTELFLLGVLGVVQWIPLFAGRFYGGGEPPARFR